MTRVVGVRWYHIIVAASFSGFSLERRERGKAPSKNNNDKNEDRYLYEQLRLFLFKKKRESGSVGGPVRIASCGQSGSILSEVSARETSW